MNEEIERALLELSKISTLLVKYDRLLQEEKDNIKREREFDEIIKKHNQEREIQIKEENKKELAKDLLKLFQNNISAVAVTNEDSQLNNICNKIYQFSQKEIDTMPKKFRDKFKKGKIKANVRKKPNGSYEIRCQINHINLSCCNKLLEKAKKKFIDKLNEIIKQPKQTIKKKILLKEYVEKWLVTTKKPFIKEDTYKGYIQTVECYIYPVFEKREIQSIKQSEIQELINKYIQEEKYKTAVKIYQLLLTLFNYAEADDIIRKSPMKLIRKPQYEKKISIPLTRTEEKELINTMLSNNKATFQAYCFIIYTGLRRSELATIQVDENWIKVKTAKQRKGIKEKYREIPISPMLKKILHLIDVEKIKKISTDLLTKDIKLIFPNHHLHELRHTFITRCQECDIQREIVSLWAGHSADTSLTSTVYTHLEQNKEHQIEEIQKYTYDL